MNYKKLTEQIVEIARITGQFIKEERFRFDANKVEEKSHNSLVSYVDKEAEKRIVDFCSKLLPEAGFITEEETINKKNEALSWIIDPLDGTTNFIHGVPFFAVSIALQQENKIVAGCTYECNLEECYYAWQDGGTWLNNKKIYVSKTKLLKDSLLATGFPYYDYEKLDQSIELFKRFLKHCRRVRRPGSAATDLAYVAAGRFDGFYEYSLKSWDVAAGIILIKEAGGVLSDFSGGNNYLFGEEIITSNNFIFNELLETVRNKMR